MILIIDDFYRNPDEVREMALSLKFDVKGNYPGARTECISDGGWRLYIKEYLESLINKKITNFPYEYNTSFQFTTKDSKTWVHHDALSYAAVVYLTPNPEKDSGTAIFRHKKTGIMKHYEGAEDFNNQVTKEEDWEMVVEAKNVYNRIVIYDSMYYHRSVVPGFGSTKHDGRLFQTFFFDTQES